MKYLGSKNRISKYIAPILQDAIDTNDIKTYVEPFGGGMNMIDKISCECRIANDSHYELIEMWRALQNGWEPPPHISEEEYLLVKSHRDSYPPYYVGYVGYAASLEARYFEGYAKSFKDDGVTPRDCSNESYRNIMKQLPKLQDVLFMCEDYRTLNFYDAVIYCDPPYQDTKKYHQIIFDYDEFWEWCRIQSYDNFLFVSGYEAPDDFLCVWQKDVLCNFDSQRDENSNKHRTEKLFVFNKTIVNNI